MILRYTPPVPTIAQLLHDLGDIPLQRVWLVPPPGTATEKDVIEAHDKYDCLCELVDGTLVEKTVGLRESREAIVLGGMLDAHTEARDLGLIVGADGAMKIMPSLIRIPDISFVSWQRLPKRELPTEPIPNLVPNLAVECLSEGNTPREMQRKLREYFEAGVQQVWFVDGKAKTFELFTSPHKSQVLTGKQKVKGGKLLPGLEFAVEAFFNRVHRKK